VDQRFSVDLEVGPERLFAIVADLGTYDQWLDIVHRVEPADAVPGDAGPAWWVTLRARLGPLARSKRLRMVRAVHTEPTLARFERREIDGRRHSAWVLTSSIGPTMAPSGITAAAGGGVDGDPEPLPPACALTMELSYDGGFWSPVLEAVLGGQVERASARLVALTETIDRPGADRSG
jgi:hypothetical protein